MFRLAIWGGIFIGAAIYLGYKRISQSYMQTGYRNLLCYICTDNVSPFECVAQNCGHTFHRACLSDAMNNGQRRCPECRREFIG